MTQPIADFDLTGAFPFDGDMRGGVEPSRDAMPALLGETPFLYIGRGLTLSDFASYVASYDFGSIPPDYVVLHHTAIPSATWARYPSGAVWDDHEDGLTEAAIYDKRTRQLDALAHYYAGLGWDRGPHLFIDDRWIWLFTPMYEIGIHAAQGNSYKAQGGKLHYSIGIEVIGYYEKTTWPAPVARNVAGVVAALKQRLKTFDYIDKPWAGGVGAHRMYNKPSCPGAAIVPSYYLPLFKETAPPSAAPVARRFIVRSDMANIRNGKSQKTKYLGLLNKGDPWAGVVVRGQKVTVKGFGATDEWVKNERGCVWRGLLEDVKD